MCPAGAHQDLSQVPPPPPSLSPGPTTRLEILPKIASFGRRGWLFVGALCLIVVAAVYGFKRFQVTDLVHASNRPPLEYEFFDTKDGCGIMFKLTISEGREFPYDEVIVRVTRVMGSDGRNFGDYYLLTKKQLMAGRCLLNTPSGVNPYGSDCKPGDRYIIQVPKYSAPLVIVCPDSSSGLRTNPYLDKEAANPSGK